MKKSFVLVSAIMIAVLSSSEAAGQSKDHGEFIQKVTRDSMMLNQIIQMSINKSLAGELEIVDSQVDQVRKIGTNYQKKISEMAMKNMELFQDIQKAHAAGNHKEATDLSYGYYEQLNEFQTKTLEELDEVLLPHQIKRLRQIAVQNNFRLMKRADFFAIPYAMSDDLKLSAEQKRELKKLTDEVRQKYYEDIKKIREKSMKKILTSLPPDKRKQVEEAIGDFFDNSRGLAGTAVQPPRRQKDRNKDRNKDRDKDGDRR